MTKNLEQNIDREFISEEGIYINKDYVLFYEYLGQDRGHASIELSGYEVQEAVLNLSEHCVDVNYLYQVLSIWGRLKTGTDLLDTYEDSAVDLVKSALGECLHCQETLRHHFSSLMASSLDHVLGGDICAMYMQDAYS